MKAMTEILKTLVRAAVLLVLLGAMLLLGGMFEGGLCLLEGTLGLALSAAGLCGLGLALRALSAPARQKPAVRAACPHPCKGSPQGLRIA